MCLNSNIINDSIISCFTYLSTNKIVIKYIYNIMRMGNFNKWCNNEILNLYHTIIVLLLSLAHRHWFYDNM